MKIFIWEKSDNWYGKVVTILAESEEHARALFGEQNPVNEAAQEAFRDAATEHYWEWAKTINAEKQRAYEEALVDHD